MNSARRIRVCVLVVGLLLLLAAGQSLADAAAPRIELVEFGIEPTELRLGDAFTIRARAVATGVKLGSFVLRSADDCRREDAIPGFPLYANHRYYVAEKGRYFLMDGGEHDRDARQNAFAIQLSTKGWKEGRYTFALFASCRPSEGPFVAARRDFSVEVKADRVRILDLGPTPVESSRAIADFGVHPTNLKPGQSVRVTLGVRPGAVTGVQLTNPFYVAEADTLPGFHYDAEKKKSFYGGCSDAAVEDNGRLDRNPVDGRMVLELDTSGWPPGVHHFRLDVLSRRDKAVDYRTFAVKVVGPKDRLEITVEDSYYFAPGTHFGRFIRLDDGTLLCEDKFSADGGRTWRGPTGGFGVGGRQLRDGRVLGLEYRCLPEESKPGWYQVPRSLSTDNGRRFEKTQAKVHVPNAKAAMGHAFHPGPLFMRSIVERVDGSLVALMAGWFKSDTALCPYSRGRPYSRTYVCQSDDSGQTWHYLTTIGYARVGSEGYNEGSMRRLPSGELLAVMRTGNERDFNCQDNPIMVSTSRDEGRTWSQPRRTGLEGAYPSLAVLSDRQVVMSYGRPGAMMAFSADAGRTWTDPTPIDATPYSGYTDVVELDPGLLLVGFGTKGYLDPTTGVRQDQLRLARIRYEKKR